MHLLKSIRNDLINHEILISSEVLEFYKINCVSNIVSFNWIREFNKVQRADIYPLIDLRRCHLYPNNFEKMKVTYARRVFSREVAAGMLSLIERNILPEQARLTAIFIAFVDSWFHIISNRSVAHAFHRNNLEQNIKSFQILLKFADFFAQCIFLDPKRGNIWLPV